MNIDLILNFDTTKQNCGHNHWWALWLLIPKGNSCEPYHVAIRVTLYSHSHYTWHNPTVFSHNLWWKCPQAFPSESHQPWAPQSSVWTWLMAGLPHTDHWWLDNSLDLPRPINYYLPRYWTHLTRGSQLIKEVLHHICICYVNGNFVTCTWCEG